MKQHFQIPWAQILIVCAALVMALGNGGALFRWSKKRWGNGKPSDGACKCWTSTFVPYLRIWVIRIFLPWRLP